MTRRPTNLLAPAIVLLTVLAPLAALGHALLIESSPKEGDTLTPAAATQAALRFNARLEKKVTRIGLVNSEGAQVKLPAQPDDKDGPADRVVIALPPALNPGSYYIEYRVLATDGHSTPGLVRFNVAGPTTAPAVAATMPVGGSRK